MKWGKAKHRPPRNWITACPEAEWLLINQENYLNFMGVTFEACTRQRPIQAIWKTQKRGGGFRPPRSGWKPLPLCAAKLREGHTSKVRPKGDKFNGLNA